MVAERASPQNSNRFINNILSASGHRFIANKTIKMPTRGSEETRAGTRDLFCFTKNTIPCLFKIDELFVSVVQMG